MLQAYPHIPSPSSPAFLSLTIPSPCPPSTHHSVPTPFSRTPNPLLILCIRKSANTLRVAQKTIHRPDQSLPLPPSPPSPLSFQPKILPPVPDNALRKNHPQSSQSAISPLYRANHQLLTSESHRDPARCALLSHDACWTAFAREPMGEGRMKGSGFSRTDGEGYGCAVRGELLMVGA